MKHKLLLKNAIILTVTSLILRSFGMIFRIWMTNTVGAEGIGLYQLLISVYVFASSFATAGICTAVTRMTAELAANGGSSKKIMQRALSFTFLISALTIAILITFADTIAIRLVDDPRAVSSVKILGLGIPFVGFCACFRGYFLAKRKTTASSISQIIEQAVRIAAVILLVGKVSHLGIEYTVAAIILGDGIAEAAGCVFMYIVYRYEYHKTDLSPVEKVPVTRKLLHIAIPITAGKYTHTALRAWENLLVPSRLSLYTRDKTRALEEFGMLKGMTLPLLFFPASFLTAFSTLLIPEISEALVLKQNYKLRSATERAIGITIIISTLIGGIFYLCGEEISSLIYPESDIGPLIIALAPLVPLMYLECVSDGILKGLDQQNYSFLYSVIDSSSRIGLIYFILPESGMTGFIVIMFYSNLLTSLLNIRRLLKVTGTSVKIGSWIMRPLVSVIIGIGIGSFAMSAGMGAGARLGIGAFVCGAVYLLIMFFWGELKIVDGMFK